MKTATLILFLLTTAIQATEPEAAKPAKPDPSSEYLELVNAARHRYLARLSETFVEADELEVFLITPKVTKPDQEVFSNAVGGQFTYVVEQRVVDGEAIRPWVRAIQGTLRNAGDNTIGCHNPIHGIKLWKRKIVAGRVDSKELLFESTLCWGCSNFGARLPDHVSIFAFPDRSLHDLCIKLLPIPEALKADKPEK